MANRYWVGGAGTWNTTSTTNWSASSGGASGASAPTAADDIFFDQAGTYTVTVTGGLCRNITVSAGTVTFSLVTTGPTISGSMSLVAGTVWSGLLNTNFNATTTGNTVTTNGVAIQGPIIFNSAGAGGGAWTLGSALTSTSGQIQLGLGSLNSGNYAISAASLNSSGAGVRSINLGSSTVTLSTNSTSAVSLGTIANLTWNAGTSQINLTGGSTSGINSGGLTFYNVSFATANPSITITGNNTFNNLSFAGRSTIGTSTITISGNQTVNGTLTLSGAGLSVGRSFMVSDAIGTQRTLTVNALAAGASDYDFRDIAVTGAAAPLTGTRFGDCKGNSGITFPAAKTVYYRQTGSASWGTTSPGSWSATSGGAADATQFPLAQDTAVFPAATYPASGSTTTINGNYNIGTINMSLRTSNTMTLAMGSNAILVYGNWINGTGITISGTGSLTFQGRGAQTITSAGRSFTQNIGTTSPGGSVTLQDALTTTTSTQSGCGGGTFDANGYNFTAIGYSSNNTGVRTIAIGSGTWTLYGSVGNTWNTPTITNLTVTGTGTISLTSATAKSFAGGGISYSNITLNQGGAGALTVTGSNRFAAITATAAGTVALTSGTTTQAPLVNTTGTDTITVTPTSTTATIRGSVRSSRANLTGPLVLGAS